MPPAVVEAPANEKRTTPATEPNGAAEAKLTARDILHPAEQWFAVTAVEDLLGIPAERTIARHRRQLAEGRGPFSQHAGDGSRMRLYGSELIGWIEREKVPHQVTPYGRAQYERRHARPEFEPEPRTDVAEQAFDRIRARQRAEAEAAARAEDERWAAYVDILSRWDDATDRDAHALADLCIELELTEDQVRADRGIIENIERLQRDHDEPAATDPRVVEQYRRSRVALALKVAGRRPELFVELDRATFPRLRS